MANHLQIAIVGGSIWGNRGAEAMMVSTIAEIRNHLSNPVFNVYTIYPNRDNLLVKDENINFFNGKPLAFALLYFPFSLMNKLFVKIGIRFPFPKSLRNMKDSCCLLDMGGITFSDGRTLQLLYNVFSIWPAMLLDVPVIKLSQAMGPFQNPLNRVLAYHFLSKCKMVFARGEITVEHLKTLKFPANKFGRSADIAFLFQPDDSPSEENEEAVSNLAKTINSFRRNGRKGISIIPSSLVFGQSKNEIGGYVTKLMAIIREISLDNHYVVVMPNASRAGSCKNMNNDLIVIDKLRKRALQALPKDIFLKISWVDFDINARSIRVLVGRTDALITSRFHGMVAGLSLCVPTMVIGWSHKYQETLSEFGMDGYAINYKASYEETLGLFRKFWESKDQIQRGLENNLLDVKKSSLAQFDYIRENILYNYKLQ